MRFFFKERKANLLMPSLTDGLFDSSYFDNIHIDTETQEEVFVSNILYPFNRGH